MGDSGTADEIYGGDRRLRRWLEEHEQPFVLAVTSTEPLLNRCGVTLDVECARKKLLPLLGVLRWKPGRG